MKLLHIVATPRPDNSNTLRVSDAYLEALKAQDGDLTIEVLDLFKTDVPAVAGDNIEAKYTLMIGQPIDQRHQKSWQLIESLIEHFRSADAYLISAPMWNFNIPYALKYYIDAIVQPGYLFYYNEMGQAIGMIEGKKMVCITTRGGDYSEGSPYQPYDFQEPYLRAIFGFVGITDMHFINAQPMDVTPEMREAAVEKGIEEARELAASGFLSAGDGSAAVENPKDLKPEPLKE
jgi:FMN-dependent NADH-azoreductase